MKKRLYFALVLVFLLSGCGPQKAPATQPTVDTTQETTVETTPVTAEPTTEPTTVPTTLPEHSALYLPNVSVEDVIRYFNEVCLDAEFVNAGDPTRLQKWVVPIRYILHGDYTEQDKAVLEAFVSWLNGIEGFPGMHQVQDPMVANLRIHFCEYDEYLALMGEQFSGTDGGITFWYNGADQIYDAVIGYCTEVNQEVRNSVILEEIYNGLGPINDTWERTTSVIYAGYSTPQSLSQVDELLLRLLYHPKMQCGMDAAQCEEIIRQLYY